MACPECGSSVIGPLMFGEWVCDNPICGNIIIETEDTQGED